MSFQNRRNRTEVISPDQKAGSFLLGVPPLRNWHSSPNGTVFTSTSPQAEAVLPPISLTSPARALRIARTTGGTAQSIGQVAGALSVGATKKVWRDSNFEVREEHLARDGETVSIDDRFSRQFPDGSAPRWPLDQNTAAADRINCRCSMTFEM